VTDSLRWYVVRTQPQREKQVEAVLRQRGVEMYLPRILSRKKDRLGQRLYEPLFPGYAFARLALDSQSWLQARSAPGVSYFLGTRSQGKPVPVPDDLVQEIRDKAEAHLLRGWQPGIKSGDRVVICGGPFAGLEAVFDGVLSPSGRSRVLVQMLTRLVPVELEVDSLRRAM
jgi:transcription elongation factor/antiterminator RfaH